MFKYIKSGLFIILLVVLIFAVENIYKRRYALERTNKNLQQNVQRFEEQTSEDFSNLQDEVNESVEEAEKIYSTEMDI